MRRATRTAVHSATTARRWAGVLGAMDPITLGGGASMGEKVRDAIEMTRDHGFDPDNMGALLGGCDVGIGTDCAHLDGPAGETKERAKISKEMSTLFPADFVPPENAMAIATAPTSEELAQQEAHEAIKEAVRDRYMMAQNAKHAEKRRIEEADKRLHAAVTGKAADAPTPATSTPSTPKRSILESLEQGSAEYDRMESFGSAVSDVLKKGKGNLTESDVMSVMAKATTAHSDVVETATPSPSRAAPTKAVHAIRSVGTSRSAQIEVMRSELIDFVNTAADTAQQLGQPQLNVKSTKSAVKMTAAPQKGASEKKKISLRDRLKQQESDSGEVQVASSQGASDSALHRRILELELRNSVLEVNLKLRDLQAVSIKSA